MTTVAIKAQQPAMQLSQSAAKSEQFMAKSEPLVTGQFSAKPESQLVSEFERFASNDEDLPDVPAPKLRDLNSPSGNSKPDLPKSLPEKTASEEAVLAKAGSIKTEFTKSDSVRARIVRAGKLGFSTSFLIRSAVVYGAAVADMHEWLSVRNELIEQNPLAKPFAHLPAPAYYGVGFTLATGVNFVGYKMESSPRWYRFRFLPQLIAIGGNTFGFFHTRYAAAHCPTCIIPTGLKR